MVRKLEVGDVVDSIILQSLHGAPQRVELVQVGKEKDELAPLFDGLTGPCPRCEAEPKRKGGVSGGGGWISFGMIDKQGTMWRAVAACDCIFGAYRKSIAEKSHPIPWADEIPGIPRNMSQADWRLLMLYHRKGMCYEDVAEKIPETLPGRDGFVETGKARIRAMIDQWRVGNPRIYEPFPKMKRTMPETEDREVNQ